MPRLAQPHGTGGHLVRQRARDAEAITSQRGQGTTAIQVELLLSPASRIMTYWLPSGEVARSSRCGTSELSGAARHLVRLHQMPVQARRVSDRISAGNVSHPRIAREASTPPNVSATRYSDCGAPVLKADYHRQSAETFLPQSEGTHKDQLCYICGFCGDLEV